MKNLKFSLAPRNPSQDTKVPAGIRLASSALFQCRDSAQIFRVKTNLI
jgi:hypothetical protein